MHRIVTLIAVAGCLTMVGCATPDIPETRRTGLLSSYRNMEKVGDSTWRFIDMERLARYDKFTFEKVEVVVPPSSNAKLTEEEKARGAEYMEAAITKALGDKYPIVNYEAGPDIAMLRIFFTNAYNDGKHVYITLEGEIVDSVSSVQVASIVETKRSKEGSVFRSWREAYALGILDQWAQRLRALLDHAHDAK